MRKLLLLGAVLALGLGVSAPADAGEPLPVAGQGYAKVFEDNFDTFSTANWDPGLWYHDPQPRPDEVFVSNGVLNLISKRVDGYPDTDASTHNKHAWTYGYFEAKMKWTAGNGGWPSFWMASPSSANNPNHHWDPALDRPPCDMPRCGSLELDWFEGIGNRPGHYGTAVHSNTGSKYGYRDEIVGKMNVVPFDLTQWNRYQGVWTPETIKFYVNDQFLFQAPTPISGHQPEFAILSMWMGDWYGDLSFPPDASTPDNMINQVDYVQVWQKP